MPSVAGNILARVRHPVRKGEAGEEEEEEELVRQGLQLVLLDYGLAGKSPSRTPAPLWESARRG